MTPVSPTPPIVRRPVWILVGEQTLRLPSEAHQLELGTWLPKRARSLVVLAVDCRWRCAAEGYILRSRVTGRRSARHREVKILPATLPPRAVRIPSRGRS